MKRSVTSDNGVELRIETAPAERANVRRFRGLATTQLSRGDVMTTANSSPTPTSVYKYYDEHGVLLYVGITNRGVARNVEHNRGKEWWPFVARQDVEHFESRKWALGREKNLIRELRPPFNKQHNPDHAVMRDCYMAFASGALDLRQAIESVPGKRVDLTCVNRGPNRFECSTVPTDAAVMGFVSEFATKCIVTVKGSTAKIIDSSFVGHRFWCEIETSQPRWAVDGTAMFRVSADRPARLQIKRIDILAEEYRGGLQ